MSSVATDRRQGINASAAIKVPCKAATTAAVTLSGEQTIDGVSCVTGDRVLVKDQSDGKENGIYVVDTGGWTRAPDWDGSLDVRKGTVVYVHTGSASDGYWYVSTADPIVVGTTSVTLGRASTELAVMTAFGQSLVDDDNAAEGRTTLGAAASGANTDITSIALSNTGLTVKDTGGDHALTVKPGRDLSAARTLTLGLQDADQTLGVPHAPSARTLSGTLDTITGIPSWVTLVHVNLRNVSTDGTNSLVLRIGPSGGVESSGYASAAQPSGGSAVGSTSNFVITGAMVAAGAYNGTITLVQESPGSNIWSMTANIVRTDGTYVVHHAAGSKALAGALERVELAAGGNTLDAGEWNVRWS